tara:strand:- start:956 stop:1489 length:534 start_codon:yes stop_codon:yes gene_type:complete
MKKLIICITVFISSITFANEITYDYVVLQNGKYFQGQVVDIGRNKIKMNVGVDIKIIKNKDILILTFDQELTSKEKYSIGFLDGKRYAKNQTGNLILGIPSIIFFGAPILVIYLTSNQKPHNLGITEKNKLIIDDLDYLRGYKKGAKQKSALKALEGVLYGALASLGIVLVALSSFP